MIISWKDSDNAVRKDWRLLQQEIYNSSDKLKKNYIGLDPLDFLDFHLVLSKNNEIEAFAGVQEKSIWRGFKRIATRLYIRPKFRKISAQGSALDQYTKTTSYTSLLLHHQIGHYDNDLIFLSRECTFRSFDRFMKSFDLSQKFILLDGFYRICGLESSNPACIQKIAINRNSCNDIDRIEYLKY